VLIARTNARALITVTATQLEAVFATVNTSARLAQSRAIQQSNAMAMDTAPIMARVFVSLDTPAQVVNWM
jgi:hypothetical protein